MVTPTRPSPQLRVLGALVIEDDGVHVPLGGPAARRLLAALIVQRRRVASTDWLIEVLWRDPPERALPTLHTSISRLRRVLPTWLQLDRAPPGYRLNVGPGDVDIDCFQATIDRLHGAAAMSPADALERLDQALAMWSGPPFGEFHDEWWARAEAARLDELHLVAREERLDVLMALGRTDVAVSQALALTAEQRWRERSWRALMLSLHRTGRQGDALRAAHSFRAQLRDELGLDPSAAFVVLERDIAAASEELLSAPPAASLGQQRTSPHPRPAGPEPAAPTSDFELVGREADLVEVTARLDAYPLVTLLGPGGIGKTRLAMTVARQWAAQHRHPVGVVELARVRDETSVNAAVATQLDVQPQQGRTALESVVDLLGAGPRLVVLDNCEHVLDPVAQVIQELLRRCPQVRILATSRAPIEVAGEAVHPVAPLSAARPLDRDGGGEAAAVRLFDQRARAANPAFRLDDASRPMVERLCERLDGLPLAIELAAARTRSLSLADLLSRLGNRFDVLGSRRVGEAHQRSLRELVDWSYRLLSTEEQRLFERLSVFAGSFDLDAVERVCCDDQLLGRRVPSLISSLVDKSMVQPLGASGGAYRLLETLRDYASLLAEPDGGVRDRLRRWVVGTCAQAAGGLFGPDERAWHERMDAMFDDVRLVVAHALEHDDFDTSLPIIVDAREYAFRRLRYEHIGWAETAITSDGIDEHPLAPATYGIVAYGHFVKGEARHAVSIAEHAVQLADRVGADTLGIAERALGNAWSFLGTLTPALDRLISVSEASGVPARIAHAYYMHAVREISVGNLAAAARSAELAQRAAVTSDNPTALAQAAFASGIVLTRSDTERAAHLLQQAEVIARAAGNTWFELCARTENLSMLALHGRPHQALAQFADVIAGWQRAGEWANQWLSLRTVFAICHQVGAVDLAAAIHNALHRANALHAYPYEPLTAARVGGALADGHYHGNDDGHAADAASLSALVSRIIDDIRATTSASALEDDGS